MPPIFNEGPADEDAIFSRVHARQSQQLMAREQATPDLAFRVAELADAYGATAMPPGAIVSLAREGIRPGDPAAETLARRAAADSHSDGVMDAVSGLVSGAASGLLTGLKGATRTAFTVFETAMDELVTRPFRTAVGVTRDVNDSEGFDTLADIAGFVSNPAQAGMAAGELVGRGQGDIISRNYQQAGESVGVKAIRQLNDPGGVDLGSGFFPGGSARQQSIEDNQLRFRDEPISPGRFFGGYVTEPGSTPYKMVSGMVDAATQIALDPSIVALSAGSKVNAARKAFELPGEVRSMDDVRRTMGAAAGHRYDVDRPYFVDRFLNQEKAGRQLKEHLASTRDAEHIWEVLGRTPNRDLISRIRDTEDPVEVGDLLTEALGLSVRERPTHLTRAKLKASNIPLLNRSLSDLRMLDEIPGRSINVENPDETLETFVQYTKNANLPSATRKNLVSNYMNLRPGDHTSALQLATDMADEIDKVVKSRTGSNTAVARRITRLFDDWAEETRAYFVDEIGRDVPVLGATRSITRNGETTPIPVKTPHLTTELLSRSIPLPDFRQIRRATANPALQRILDSGVGKFTTGLAENFMQVWKPLQLLRAAWAVRVIGEEQVRLAGAGLDSSARHPASFIGWMVSEDNKHLGRIAKGERDAFGNPLGVSDQHKAAMSSRAAGWLGEPGEAVINGDYVRYTRESNPVRGTATDDDTFVDMWSDELRQLWNDEVASRVARGSDFTFTDARTGQELTGTDAVKEWFWSSSRGHEIRKMFAEGAGSRDSAKWALVDEGVARRVGREMDWPVDEPISVEGLSISSPTAGPLGAHSASRRASDHYIDSISDRISVKTRNDPDLINAIATGKLDGIDLRRLDSRAQRRLHKSLANRIDIAPEVVKGPRLLSGDRVSRLDRFVETMFDTLMGTPTNKLSRSPAFRQFYAQRMEELAPRVSPSLRDDMVAWASDNNLDDVAETLRRTTGASEHIALETMEEIDLVSKQFALDETRKLLYDMDRRGQFFDATRTMIPFGEAWKEVVGTWSRLLTSRPQNLRRFQQTVQGARGDEDGKGIFYTDPVTGEEMFNYPLVGPAMTHLINNVPGLPDLGNKRLTARGNTQSLNLVSSSLLPGLGPLAAIGASNLLRDTPDMDFLRDALLPFGEEHPGGIGGFVQEMLPAWADKIHTSFFGDDRNYRLYANTRMSVVQGMVSSGDYDPSQIQQAVRDSAAPAKMIYLLRGLAQFALPTGPDIQHDLKDDDGRWHGAQVLSNELREMAEEAGDYDAATAQFVDRFGLDPLLISQGRTRTVAKRSFEKEGWAWERDHQDKLRVAPTTLGYFAPIGDPDRDEFVYPAYLDAIREGSSIPLTASQQAAAYNNQVGWSEYRRFKDKVEKVDISTEARRALLSQYRAGLKVAYPGFDSITEQLPSKPPFDAQIAELSSAVRDPVLGETEAGKGIREYLELREGALEMADGAGLGGKRDVVLRQALHTLGKKMARDNPDFAPVWMEVLSREVDDVEPFTEPPPTSPTTPSPTSPTTTLARSQP